MQQLLAFVHPLLKLPTCSPRPLHPQHLLFATQSSHPATTPAGCQPAAQDPCIPSICCLRPSPPIQHLANLQPKTPASPAFVVCDPVLTSSHNTCRLPTCSPRSLHPQHLLFATQCPPIQHLANLQPKIPAYPAFVAAQDPCRPVFVVGNCIPSILCLRPSPHIQPQHLQVVNLCVCDKSSHPVTTLARC